MPDSRPDPEAILAKVKQKESKLSHGRLKIFLGAAPGVGKTYTMLEAARKLKSDGVDVVAGCVVTHGRPETEALLAGIEQIPLRQVEYRDTKLEELDIDAVLTRKPQVALIDELAHTNAPGCRHPKRWQDIEELLDAGINVYTTMNVQHLESANDIVAKITRVRVRETVPDSLIEKADEVELVDLPPVDLIQRLKEGKVYAPERSEKALDNFFRKGNLIALRELALRLTAERVDAQMQEYREDEAIKSVWPASERILVCVGPSPHSTKLLRATKRMARSLHADWFAAFVETQGTQRLSEESRLRLINTLRLAEQLGATTVTLTGSNVAEELVSYAVRHNISRIIIGKPARSRWKEILFGSVVDDLVRRSGDIDVNVITGDKTTTEATKLLPSPVRRGYARYIYATVAVIIATLLDKAMFGHIALVNLVMIYQLLVVLIAYKYGKGPSILATILSVGAFDFFFVPPYMSFAVSDTQYLLTLAIMLAVALMMSTLTYTVRHQAEVARERESMTAALYAMTKALASAADRTSILQSAIKHISEVFAAKTTVYLVDEQNKLSLVKQPAPTFDADRHEAGVAEWVFNNKQMAGASTQTLPGSKAIYFPLLASDHAFGVIGILRPENKRILPPEEMHLLETFINQIAQALERSIRSSKTATKTKS
jgi:two-component system sensor histidine kinase KdpD